MTENTFRISGGLTADQLDSITTVTTDTIDMSTISIGALGAGSNGTSASDWITGGPNTVWTATGTGGGYNWNNPTMNVSQSGKVSLQGDDADIEINGRSMSAWMEKVEERLNILTPDPELETEWDELRSLGEQYRALEQHIRDKMTTWDKLRAMPPPLPK